MKSTRRGLKAQGKTLDINCSEVIALREELLKHSSAPSFFYKATRFFFFHAQQEEVSAVLGFLSYTSKLFDLLKKKNHNLLFWELFLGRGLGCTKFKYSQVTLKKLL